MTAEEHKAGSMFRFITTGDHRLMRRANNWLAPRWVRWWMIGATRAGDGWLWYGLGLVILLFGGQERFGALAAAGLAALASIAAFQGLKRITGRKRPCQMEPHCWATLLPPDQFSFPSGHTMTAFACATAIAFFYPATAPALFFFAFSIAVSRIVLGMHFLSDVLAGAAVGSLLGWAACQPFI